MTDAAAAGHQRHRGTGHRSCAAARVGSARPGPEPQTPTTAATGDVDPAPADRDRI